MTAPLIVCLQTVYRQKSEHMWPSLKTQKFSVAVSKWWANFKKTRWKKVSYAWKRELMAVRYDSYEKCASSMIHLYVTMITQCDIYMTIYIWCLIHYTFHSHATYWAYHMSVLPVLNLLYLTVSMTNLALQLEPQIHPARIVIIRFIMSPSPITSYRAKLIAKLLIYNS